MSDFDYEFPSEASEVENFTDLSDFLSESEYSDIEIDENVYEDKNGVVWSTEKPRISKITKENIIDQATGITAYATFRVKDIMDTFLIFFNHFFFSTVICHTNKFGYSHYKSSWKLLTNEEFKAYLGILVYVAIFKSKLEPLKLLWSVERGRIIFRKIMPLKRFTQISRALHYDDFETREERRMLDKFCPIREVFDYWKDCFSKFVVPGENVTVDEQLVAFRGKCPFKQYMSSKPAVYGIKFFLLTDPETNYTHNISVYLGRNNNPRVTNVGERVVTELVSFLKDSGRNIVFDNFFTSVSLAEKLLNMGMTMVGMIRSNKREIPAYLKNDKKRDVFSSRFLFSRKLMLVSYVPKNKISYFIGNFLC